jgi:two-component system NtrC family sensor kinase
MSKGVKFPIRLKIMISLLCGIAAVVSVITFTMANFFHDDKKSYLNDWASIAALNTAVEARSLLRGYAERLEVASMVILSEKMQLEEREQLAQRMLGTFPDLIAATIYQDGEPLEEIVDQSQLTRAGLSSERFEQFREDSKLPLTRIASGETYLRSADFSSRLPSMELAFPIHLEGDDAPYVVSALISLDGLMRVGANFRVFEIHVMDRDGILLAHPDASRVARHEAAGLSIDSSGMRENFQAGMTIEHVHEGREMLAGIAPADFGVTVVAQLPQGAAYLASRQLLARLVMVALVLLVVAAVLGRLWARRITRPVERLSEATRTIAKGTFDINVGIESRDEIGALAGSFNQMATELHDRDEALELANSKLVQSEKMAAFGELSAGIAHEVKNPLAGILGCTQLALLDAEPASDLEEGLKLIEKETERCAGIINNLMRFARQEKAELEPTEINLVVDDAVAIVNHQLELNRVKVIKDLGENLPQVSGNANQLQQVLMNLMMNAQQAMEEGGLVTVSTRQIDQRLEIVVSDTGPGIPPELQGRLFEPFFTTKPTGKGTGLGLSVSFGIVKDHEGEISVESELGKGTNFIIELPLAEEQVDSERLTGVEA